GDRVVVQSIHSSKGEEYETVFMAGCEENVLPSRQSLRDGDEAKISEERRLMFVGITRAKTNLAVSLCRVRGSKSRANRQLPSQFLEQAGLDRLYQESSGRDTDERQGTLFMP
ncbi:MAG: ATP-dependent helicase, partial [Bdellovibrionales bacterium]|nr:ATP-dependent helicase [Bdellovibrionales bacterium]